MQDRRIVEHDAYGTVIAIEQQFNVPVVVYEQALLLMVARLFPSRSVSERDEGLICVVVGVPRLEHDAQRW